MSSKNDQSNGTPPDEDSMSEWMRVMLDEIDRKEQEAEEGLKELAERDGTSNDSQ
jgi:hypothetical protein